MEALSETNGWNGTYGGEMAPLWRVMDATQLLDPETERTLLRLIAKKDLEALTLLVHANVGLVIDLADKSPGRTNQDIFQNRVSAGMVGLLEAAWNFDMSNENRFSTYATYVIRGAINDAKKETMGIDGRLTLPVARYVRRHVLPAAEELEAGLGVEPTVDQIMVKMRENMESNGDDVVIKEKETIERYLRNYAAAPVSIDFRSEKNGMAETDDLIGSDPSPDEEVIREDEAAYVGRLLKQLEPRLRMVLHLYFGFNGNEPQSMNEIAETLKISKERVRQIRNRAFEKLREMMDEDSY